jgi:hypothetical protein
MPSLDEMKDIAGRAGAEVGLSMANPSERHGADLADMAPEPAPAESPKAPWMNPGRAAAFAQMGKGIGGIIQGAFPRKTWQPIRSLEPIQYGPGPLANVAAAALSDVRAKSDVEPATHPSIEEVLGRPNPAMRFEPMIVHRSKPKFRLVDASPGAVKEFDDAEARDFDQGEPERDLNREALIRNAIPPMPAELQGRRAYFSPETGWVPREAVVGHGVPPMPDVLIGKRAHYTPEDGWRGAEVPTAPRFMRVSDDPEEAVIQRRKPMIREVPVRGEMHRERPMPPLTSENIEDFMDPLRAKTYRYKEPFASKYGSDTKLGVIAQDVKKSDVGNEIVFRDPQSGMLALDLSPQKFGPITLASLANLNQRLDRLEGRKGRGK